MLEGGADFVFDGIVTIVASVFHCQLLTFWQGIERCFCLHLLKIHLLIIKSIHIFCNSLKFLLSDISFLRRHYPVRFETLLVTIGFLPARFNDIVLNERNKFLCFVLVILYLHEVFQMEHYRHHRRCFFIFIGIRRHFQVMTCRTFFFQKHFAVIVLFLDFGTAPQKQQCCT